MKKLRYSVSKIGFVASLIICASCSTEPVELETTAEDSIENNITVNKVQGCNKKGYNTDRNHDIKNPVNVGKIDDRTCFANYTESRAGGRTYGNYFLKAGSNHIDNNRLQPRMERTFPRANNKSGSYLEFKGTVRILEVGKTKGKGGDGTYIAQAKGQHTGGGGSKYPAICLYEARPVYGRDRQGRWGQIAFDIYREQINYRGGEGRKGRKYVYLTTIKRGVPTYFELKVGFRTSNGKKVHYANAKIGRKTFYFNIPQPNRGKHSELRYGAYSVRGGKARIQWADTKFKRVNK